MSDKKLNEKLAVISKDAVIEIKVSGQYYHDLKILINNLLQDETKESIGVILSNITDKKITSEKEHILYMLFAMVGAIETEAKEKNMIEYKTVEDLIGEEKNEEDSNLQDS